MDPLPDWLTATLASDATQGQGVVQPGLRPLERDWRIAAPAYVIQASANMGLTVSPSFSGALLWPFLYPWPQRPAGLVEDGFKDLKPFGSTATT